MTTAAEVLGKFAAELDYADIPGAVVERARYCIIDAVGVATFGSQFPWSRMVAEYAGRYGSGGPCSVIAIPGMRVHAPYAALANGVFTHAFEQDSLRDPGAGAHPGATLLPPLLAVCEEAKVDGKTAMAAFVAANEVMMRIALASHHSPEKVGFHAPGLTGCYGGAIAAGRALRLTAQQLANALGIAGSLSSGLLAFSKSKHGGMIKRLHLGRASESGILAARLAQSGYEAPETVLEGKFGFLDAYCGDHETDAKLLTADLGGDWETLRICIKRYACHVNAHAPVQGLRELMAEQGFKGTDIAKLAVDCAERLVSHHNIPEPGDIMQAQYSVPFCLALAMHRDPEDPKNFNNSALEDRLIRASCREVELRPQPERKPRSVRLNIRLKDGREFARECDKFKGTPAEPLTREDLRRKFMLLTTEMGAKAAPLFERLEKIESQPVFSVA